MRGGDHGNGQGEAEVLNSYFAGVFTDEDPHSVPAVEDRSGGRELTEVHITFK